MDKGEEYAAGKIEFNLANTNNTTDTLQGTAVSLNNFTATERIIQEDSYSQIIKNASFSYNDNVDADKTYDITSGTSYILDPDNDDNIYGWGPGLTGNSGYSYQVEWVIDTNNGNY